MPAIPASGAISLSDFATEFGGTAPHSMSEYYRNGANVPSNNSNVPTAGAFRFGQMRGAINEIILAATSGANVDISGLFGANWTSTVPKRLTVPAGVTIGGTGSSAALIIPANMAGTLEIDNAGSIIGFGGAANGGAGGNAISNSASGVTINNTGLLAGGGGGGGLGGTGGQGSTNVLTYYFSWTESYIWKTHSEDNWAYYKWAGGGQVNISSSLSVHNGHYRGPVVDSGPNPAAYQIGRYVTSYFNGGSGGSGGVGQGYNQSNTSGSGGSSGGTNAGTGGTGGSGAAYGTAGSTGATGANGNSSNGSGGASGGAAGAAVTGTSVTMNNTGTLAGAVA
jgi:hypothetical protein